MLQAKSYQPVYPLQYSPPVLLTLAHKLSSKSQPPKLTLGSIGNLCMQNAKPNPCYNKRHSDKSLSQDRQSCCVPSWAWLEESEVFLCFELLAKLSPQFIFMTLALWMFQITDLSQKITYSRWLTALAPTFAAIVPDSRLLSSSPWKLGISPIFFPSSIILVLDSSSKKFFSQNTSMKTGEISLLSMAFWTAGIWLWITSRVCSASVFPFGMACAPQKVPTIVSWSLYLCFASSMALSILT